MFATGRTLTSLEYDIWALPRGVFSKVNHRKVRTETRTGQNYSSNSHVLVVLVITDFNELLPPPDNLSCSGPTYRILVPASLEQLPLR